MCVTQRIPGKKGRLIPRKLCVCVPRFRCACPFRKLESSVSHPRSPPQGRVQHRIVEEVSLWLYFRAHSITWKWCDGEARKGGIQGFPFSVHTFPTRLTQTHCAAIPFLEPQSGYIAHASSGKITINSPLATLSIHTNHLPTQSSLNNISRVILCLFYPTTCQSFDSVVIFPTALAPLSPSFK